MRSDTAQLIHTGLEFYTEMGKGWVDAGNGCKRILIILESKNFLDIRVDPVKSADEDFSSNTLSYTGDMQMAFDGLHGSSLGSYLTLKFNQPVSCKGEKLGHKYLSGSISFLVDDSKFPDTWMLPERELKDTIHFDNDGVLIVPKPIHLMS